MPTSARRSPDAESTAAEVIAAKGVDALPVVDFVDDDIGRWTERPEWQVSLRVALEGVGRGDIDYLAIRSPTGDPIAKGGVNYVERPGAGVLFHLDTVDGLRGLGLGSRLIAEAEARIRRRGLGVAALGVEDANAAARRLYERLGYRFLTREPASWDVVGDDGTTSRHETEVDVLVKDVTEPPEPA